MALVLIPSSTSAGTSADLAALETQVAAAKATADAAVAAAANARQMVLSRDPKLNTAAADAAAAVSLRDQMDALAHSLANVQTTPGATGAPGADGAQGLRGPSGVDGAQGAPGVAGARGLTGLTGAAGSAGVAGPAGTQGIKGDTGTAGTVGPTGLTGPAGATGSAGPQGVAGPTGATGTTGPTGAQGITGDTGAAGVAGPSGTTNLAVGACPVPLVALNGNTTVTASLSHVMPNNTYRVEVAHSAVVNLANVTLTVTNKTTTGVTVKVTSVGLAIAAGTLFVVAV